MGYYRGWNPTQLYRDYDLISHCKDPYKPTSISWKVGCFFFSWLTILCVVLFGRRIGRESKLSDLENWVQNRGRVADVFWATASINTNTLVILRRSPPSKLKYSAGNWWLVQMILSELKRSLFRGHLFIFGGYQLIDYQLFGVKALHPRNPRWCFASRRWDRQNKMNSLPVIRLFLQPIFERKSNYIFKIWTHD